MKPLALALAISALINQSITYLETWKFGNIVASGIDGGVIVSGKNIMMRTARKDVGLIGAAIYAEQQDKMFQ